MFIALLLIYSVDFHNFHYDRISIKDPVMSKNTDE